MCLLRMLLSPLTTVDRGVLDSVLSSLGLPAWFRRVLRVSCSCSLSVQVVVWFGGTLASELEGSRGCHRSILFIVATYLLWCVYLLAFDGAQPQIYKDKLKCVTHDLERFFWAARLGTR